MCGRENDVFPRKFENCAVSTTIKHEQPGQCLRKPQDKSQCRQDGFLTVRKANDLDLDPNSLYVLKVTFCLQRSCSKLLCTQV